MATTIAFLESRLRRSAWAARLAAFLLPALLSQSCSDAASVTNVADTHSAATSPAPSTQVFFLSRKVGSGIVASPAQDDSHPSGTVVSYSFVGIDSAAHVIVTEDGQPVPASGTVRMDQAHTFVATIDNQPGAHAPEFTGRTADGRTVRLSDFRGKYVFVDFSEATCPGSVNEAAYLKSHYAAFQAHGMEVVTVLVYGSTNQAATSSDLVAWQQTYQLSFPVVSDLENATAIYNHGIPSNTTDFPSGYIIDGTGVIRAKFIGFDGPTIDAAIAALFP